MKISATVLLSLIAVQPVMAGTIEEMLSHLKPGERTARAERFGRPQTNVGVEFISHDFVIPVAGNAEGNFGTHWMSEVVLSNYALSKPQPIRLTFFPRRDPRETTASVPTVETYVLPAYNDAGDLGLVTTDFMGKFGRTGLAAVLVEAVDSTGKRDENAMIDGYSRIWTLQPTNAACAPSQRGTVSQGMMTVAPDMLVPVDPTSEPLNAYAVGLEHDETYRTNIGIVNLSPNRVTWRVTIVGDKGKGTNFTVSVPGKSLMHESIDRFAPDFYGTISIMFEVESIASSSGVESQHTGDASLLWNAYASSVDNRSGDGWTRQAAP